MKTIDLFPSGAGGVHTYRIPSLLATSAGTLLAFCEARRGNRGDAEPKHIVVKRGEDCGNSWSKSQLVSDGSARWLPTKNFTDSGK